MPFSEIMSGILHPLFKWMHVIAGITWMDCYTFLILSMVTLLLL